MMNKRDVVRTVIHFFVISLLFMIITSVIFILLFRFKKRNIEGGGEEFDEEWNFILNYISGDHSEFESHDLFGNLESFGDEKLQLKCSGYCYCETEEEEIFRKRRSFTSSKQTTTRTKNVVYLLVSAVSSLLAIQKAEQFFQEDCFSSSAHKCPIDSSITSELEHCQSFSDDDEEMIIKDHSFEDEDDDFGEEEHDDFEIGEDEPEVTEYECTGRCIESSVGQEIMDRCSDLDDVQELSQTHFYSEDGRDIFASYTTGNIVSETNVAEYCNTLTLKKSVFVDRLSDENEKKMLRLIPFRVQEERAIDSFTTLHLHKYCKSNSVFTTTEFKEKFIDELETKVDKRALEIMYLLNEKTFEHYSDARPLCRGTSDYYTVSYSTPTQGVHMSNVVCTRKFTDDEWEKKVPYDNRNLRHWKEGHVREPDKLKREQILAFRMEVARQQMEDFDELVEENQKRIEKRYGEVYGMDIIPEGREKEYEEDEKKGE